MTISELTTRLNQMAAQLDAGRLTYDELLTMNRLSLELYESLVLLKRREAEEKNPKYVPSPENATAVEASRPETSKQDMPENENDDFGGESSEPESAKPVAPTEEKEQPEEVDVSTTAMKARESAGNQEHEQGGKESVKRYDMEAKQITLIDSIDEIRREEKSLNERFADNTSTLGQKFQRQPIHDLRAAIGINLKFRFIDVLFDSNREAFDRAIENLNTCASIDEARTYIRESLEKRFNWEENRPAAEELLDLVERRYM